MAGDKREQNHEPTEGPWPGSGRDPRTQPQSGTPLPSRLEWRGQEREITELGTGELIDAAEALQREITAHTKAVQKSSSPREVRDLHAAAVAVKRRMQRAVIAEFNRRVTDPGSPLLLDMQRPGRRRR